MTQISTALIRLAALAALAALSEVCVSCAKLKSGVQLISGLLAIEAILSLMQSLPVSVGWTP